MHLQSMVKTSVKFQKNKNKTVRYILLYGGGRTDLRHTDVRKDGQKEGQKAENCPATNHHCKREATVLKLPD